MTIDDDYRVVTTGRILDGFDPAEVQKKLISALRLQPAQAETFFDKPRTLKKGLSWAGADKICDQLASIGVAAEIKNAPSTTAQPAPAATRFDDDPSLELVEDKDKTKASSAEGTMECPNCQHVQPESEQCENCGIFFHKFKAAAEAQQLETSGARVAPAAAAMQTNDSTVVSSQAASEEGAFGVAALVASTIAALIGALVWKFVAVTFEYEFGLIAWGIGGAVGAAGAIAGARGMLAGVMCAVLAFGSIVVGKYWAYDAFIDQVQESIYEVSENGEYDDEMYSYYIEEMEDARLFVRGSGTDTFVRQFMVDREYTYETNPASVSSDEVADFREYTEPWLRKLAAERPSYEEWQTDSAEVFEDMSPWELMFADFGILDILFIFLGIGTAFRLGSQWG